MSLPQMVWPKPSRKKVTPRVAISSATGSCATSGRRTMRSISQARITMMPAASTKATASAGKPAGMPVKPGSHSARRASASAANNTIAPCAKLKTPEALKISTKPSATRE